ncbi:MAG: DUF4390 domain-containing protein [Gemmatimonadaceae bacterium]
MRPTPLLALLVALLVTVGALPLAAQSGSGPRLEVVLPPQAALITTGPTVRAIDMITDRRLSDLLRSGFPARLHFRVELWSADGWFDDMKGRREWDVIVQYDPLEQRYRVARVTGDQATFLGVYETLQGADSAVSRAYRVPLVAPRSRDRHYYNVVLEVETLSLSDLDEVERWLRGELRPAVRGEANPGTAITRGVRTLLVRLLGGEKSQYQVRSGTFRPR